MRGSGTAVVLHLKAQMTHSDPPQHHAAWLGLPIFLQTQGGTHRFVGRLLSVILWIGLAEIRNFRINHAESARKKAKALDARIFWATHKSRQWGGDGTGLFVLSSGKP